MLGRMWWQIFKLTYRIPDGPRLVGIVYVFLTGASMRIVQLDTRIGTWDSCEFMYKQDKNLCLGHNDQCLPAHNWPQHVSGNSSL